MSSIASIAVSGMTAAVRRLEASASNVANARSDGPLSTASAAVRAQFPDAYKPLRVDQVETQGGGTRAIMRNDEPSYVRAFDPTAPYADSNGMVAQPNVDLANEAVQQLMARTNFTANALVVRAYGQMMKSLIDMKA